MSDSEQPGQPGPAGGSWVDTGYGLPDGIERLWAPYRKAYIAAAPEEREGEEADGAEDSGEESSGDPFLDAPRHDDEDSLIVARGRTVYCLLNLYPYNAGHVMVIPYRQVTELEELTAEERVELMDFTVTAIRALKLIDEPEGFNVGFNLGSGSGGSVRSHLHQHVVPRWSGDANFMTVLGGTKVLPELLKETRRRLASAWREVEAGERRRA